jgi:uncharacterized membrane protein YphA (DoxX/SURF4 family)
MAALLQYNPAPISAQTELSLVGTKKIETSDLLSNASFRMEAFLLLLLPLAACVGAALLLQGWLATITMVGGLVFLGLYLRKIHEEWKVLHNTTDNGFSLRGQQLVVGRVDAITNRKNGRLCTCNIARYHFLTREGDFRSGMYLTSANLPEAGEPLLIAYDIADPRRIRVIDSFVFYRIPTVSR